jgi:hypothetical protein
MEEQMIFTFKTCTDSIRTIPSLQHDKTNAEDIDTEAEDHAADEWRYACMSRPFTRSAPKTPGDMHRKPTLDEMLKAHDRSRKRT